MSGDHLTVPGGCIADAAAAMIDARGYHRSAGAFAAQRRPASLVFNVAALALERYLVALCYLHGAEPLNHTFGDLAYEAQAVTDLPPDLAEDVVALDEMFQICSLETYRRDEAGPQDAAVALDLCRRLDQVLRDEERSHAAAA